MAWRTPLRCLRACGIREDLRAGRGRRPRDGVRRHARELERGRLPDRFALIEDSRGNVYDPILSDEIRPDGAVVSHFGPLPPNGVFAFAIGRVCVVGTGGLPDQLELRTFAVVHFTTGP